MRIWKGYDILVAPVVFFCWGVPLLFALRNPTDPEYISNQLWPCEVGLIVAGVICRYLGAWLENRDNRPPLDPEGDEVIPPRSGPSFLFIPMRTWGPLLIFLGLLFILEGIIERVWPPGDPVEQQESLPAAGP